MSASTALGLQAHTTTPSLCVWVLGLELRTWQALKQMSRLPGSVEGRLIHWVVLSLCLPSQLQPTIQLWLGARAPMGAQQCCCCMSEKQVFYTNLTSPLCSSGWQRPIHGLPRGHERLRGKLGNMNSVDRIATSTPAFFIVFHLQSQNAPYRLHSSPPPPPFLSQGHIIA